MEEYLKEKKEMNSEVAKDIVDSEFVGSAVSRPTSARIDNSINKISAGCCVIQ